LNSAEGCPRRNSSGCFAAIQATCPGSSDRGFWRSSAASTQREGADVQERRTRVWGPPVRPSGIDEARSVGRVPRATQHPSVGGVERRAAIDERQDVVKGEVTRWMRRMLGTIARADVAVLADVAGDHPPGQASPSCIRMDVMVGTDARQARMLAAASSRSAGDDTTDGAEFHPSSAGDLATRLTLVTLDCRPFDITRIVSRGRADVYSPAVLRPRDQPPSEPGRAGHPPTAVAPAAAPHGTRSGRPGADQAQCP
jgi:hypothetical protein